MEGAPTEINDFEVELQLLNSAYQRHYEGFQKQLVSKEIEFHKSLENLWAARSAVLQKSNKPIWFDCFCNHPVLRNYISEEDEKVFLFLYDIALVYIDEGFELQFKFNPNPYLEEAVVIKRYKFVPDEDEIEPLDITKLPIELPPILESSIPGIQFDNIFTTPITWTKNILTKKVNKKQRNKHTNEHRVISTEIVLDTFFHYFKTHSATSEEIEEQELAQMDVDIADALKDDITPNLFLWYTGHADGSEILDDSMEQLDLNG